MLYIVFSLIYQQSTRIKRKISTHTHTKKNNRMLTVTKLVFSWTINLFNFFIDKTRGFWSWLSIFDWVGWHLRMDTLRLSKSIMVLEKRKKEKGQHRDVYLSECVTGNCRLFKSQMWLANRSGCLVKAYIPSGALYLNFMDSFKYYASNWVR